MRDCIYFVSFVVAGLALLAFLNFYQEPALSSRIQAWEEKGTFLKYNQHDIFYIDIKGNGKHGNILCMHGFPTFSWDWSKVVPGLQEQFSRIILLDFLGFGFSDKPMPHNYSILEQADIVTLLADTLKLDKVHLLSHDYGDTVALELLARFNQNAKLPFGKSPSVFSLQSLTLLNGGIFTETHRPRLVQKLLLLPVIGPVLGRMSFFTIFKRGFGEIFGKNKPTEEDFEDFYSVLCHKKGHHATSSLLQYIPERHSYKMRWEGALKESQVPVAMIYGPADPVNPPEFAELFRNVVPQHKLFSLGEVVGHYPQWEDAETVLLHIQEFMAEVSDLHN